VEVSIDPADNVPNRDFVLRCKIAGDGIKSGLIAHKDDKGNGGYFTLMLVPPESLRHLPRKPLEFVFTLDVSGSMSGRPIEQAKAAMRYALTHMGPDDTFQVVKFANDAEQMAPRPLPATPQNVRAALRYMDGTDAGGGTMMLEGMRKSLDFPHDQSRLRCVSFLTDGYIGNEDEILRAMHGWLGDARVFSFGVGPATNRYLLDHMAKMGNGAAAYLSLKDKADEVMGAYFERISHPALTDLQIDWGGMKVKEVFPRRMPDLFVGRPVILTGRYEGNGPTTIKVRGKTANETQAFDLPVNLDQPAADSRALPAVWARMKIADLADQSTYEGGRELADEVKQVALEYGLMSSFTAFVAVDSLTKTAGDHGTTVGVPVPVPEGVRYDTTVTDTRNPPPPAGEAEQNAAGREEGR
jgi:Ca-activated chloride channel homolog